MHDDTMVGESTCLLTQSFCHEPGKASKRDVGDDELESSEE
jgi:hypothetical protein